MENRDKRVSKGSKKPVVFAAVAVAVVIMLIVPALREFLRIVLVLILVLAWTVLPISILFTGGTSKKTLKTKLPKVISAYPNVWKTYGVEKTNMATLLPQQLLGRQLYKWLPTELRGNCPVVVIAPNMTLGASGVYNTYFSGKKACLAMLENGAVQRILLSSTMKMSERLGVDSGRHYAKVAKAVNKIDKIAEQDDTQLWFKVATSMKVFDVDIIKPQLQIICSRLGINYDDAAPDSYSPGSSSYYGFGSWGAVGLGAVLSIGSAMSANGKQSLYKKASVYIAFNNIADYFNSQYYPEEYAAQQSEQSALPR